VIPVSQALGRPTFLAAVRWPDWDEVVACRYKFIPNECQVAMLLPPVEEYINVMPTCFHLHEVADAPMPVVKR
jgi:hypothetical protein